jgi:hypothetical protein
MEGVHTATSRWRRRRRAPQPPSVVPRAASPSS